MKLSGLKLILSTRCQEASELASAALDRELTASERWGLRLHTLLCAPCRRLIQQLQMMRETMRSVPSAQWRHMNGTIARLSQDRRQQIKQLLADARRAE
jgi:Putative zinc-finger